MFCQNPVKFNCRDTSKLKTWLKAEHFRVSQIGLSILLLDLGGLTKDCVQYQILIYHIPLKIQYSRLRSVMVLISILLYTSPYYTTGTLYHFFIWPSCQFEFTQNQARIFVSQFLSCLLLTSSASSHETEQEKSHDSRRKRLELSLIERFSLPRVNSNQ